MTVFFKVKITGTEDEEVAIARALARLQGVSFTGIMEDKYPDIDREVKKN